MSLLGEIYPDATLMGPRQNGAASESRSIFFRVEEDAIFQGLVNATSLAFPGYTARIVKDLEIVQHPPSLVLFSAEQFDDLPATLMEIRSRLPLAAIGIITNGDTANAEMLQAIITRNLTQGILPLNLSLRVWLAAVWLLINGGRYLPPALWTYRQVLGLEAAAMHRADGKMADRLPEHIEADGSASLTHREQEVLRYISKGLQNKIIAVRMELSEHTVKVHVHNIIRKLGVHNRTQAANLLRNSQG